MKLFFSVSYETGKLDIATTVPGVIAPFSPKRLTPLHIDVLGNGVDSFRMDVDEFGRHIPPGFDDPVEISFRGNISAYQFFVSQEATTITFHDCPTNKVDIWSSVLVTFNTDCTLALTA